jgi:hypothetical protein
MSLLMGTEMTEEPHEAFERIQAIPRDIPVGVYNPKISPLVNKQVARTSRRRTIR